MSRKLTIPHDLHEMLQNFVVCVLRSKPTNLPAFARNHFIELHRYGMGDDSLSDGETSDTEYYTEDSDIDSNDERFKLVRRPSVLGERIDPETDLVDDERVVFPKDEKQRENLKKIISSKILLSGLDKDQIEYVIDAMSERRVTEGECVIKQGSNGNHFYIIESGNYQISIKDLVTNEVVNKGSYEGKGEFGEVALLYNCRRKATITATTDGLLWAIDRFTFNRIVVKDTARKRKLYEEFLATVPLLSTLTTKERASIADVMKTIFYKDGEIIIRQGSRPDYFYMIIEGQVIVKRRGDDPDDPEREVILNRYGKGKYFGELALITNQSRAASVFAVGSCSCAVLAVHAFERLLGSCKHLMMRNVPFYEQQLTEIYERIKQKGNY